MAISHVAACFLLVLGLAQTSPSAPAEADPKDPKTLKEPFSSSRTRAGVDEPWIEQCDGSRAPASSTEGLQCRQWKVEWLQDGKPWGVTTGSSAASVVSARERTLAFVRDEARLFEQAFDRRFASPSPPICDVCRAADPAAPSGMFGDGQRFAGSEVRRSAVTTTSKLEALQKALFEQHVPRIRDLARHASDAKTSKPVRQYVKSVHTALFDLARARLTLDSAILLQSSKHVDQVDKLIGGRTDALAKDFAAVEDAIAGELKRQYGGRWDQEGTDSAGKHLQVDFERLIVRANHVEGNSRSVWFEGGINVDGSITGHSLVAPKGGQTTCSDHTVACGFERVPAVLRFSQRRDGGQSNRNVLELWFQQGSWVRAPLFSR